MLGLQLPKRWPHHALHTLRAGSLPVPLGAAGVVTALPIEDDETILYEDDTMSMLVQFTASSRPGVEYRVFAAETGPVRVPCHFVFCSSARCVDPERLTMRIGSMLAANTCTQGPLPCQTGASTGSCIVTSVCGLETGGMVAKTGWATQDANSLVSLTVDGLKQDQEYVFNVAARDGDWQASYVATQGTPSYKRGEEAGVSVPSSMSCVCSPLLLLRRVNRNTCTG